MSDHSISISERVLFLHKMIRKHEDDDDLSNENRLMEPISKKLASVSAEKTNGILKIAQVDSEGREILHSLRYTAEIHCTTFEQSFSSCCFFSFRSFQSSTTVFPNRKRRFRNSQEYLSAAAASSFNATSDGMSKRKSDLSCVGKDPVFFLFLFVRKEIVNAPTMH